MLFPEYHYFYLAKQFKTITVDAFSVILFIAMSSNGLQHSKGMALTVNQAAWR